MKVRESQSAARWDQHPQVVSPVGRTTRDLFARRERRQPLPGFDPAYSDFVDYIVRCTHRIWEQKNIGLCRTHYASDCLMHMLAGEARGVEGIVQGTVTAMSSYADRAVIAEDVIWSEDAPGLFLSSHRIVSDATHLGDDVVLAPATLKLAGVMTIADCLVQENLIIEEWLVRDNLRAARQLGLDPWQLARRQAEQDRQGDPQRHAWRTRDMAAVRNAVPHWPSAEHPALAPARALHAAFNDDLYGQAADLVSPGVEVRWPSGRHSYGRGYWVGCLLQLRAALFETRWRLDHHAARPLPGGDVAVALRWSLCGRHNGSGVWGPATGREVLILAVSHFRLRGGYIVEDATVFDELAVLRQVVGGLGA